MHGEGKIWTQKIYQTSEIETCLNGVLSRSEFSGTRYTFKTHN